MDLRVIAAVGSAAGSAAGAAFILTTTLANQFYSNNTAAGRAQALQNLYDMVEKRHQHFVKTIFPRLKEAGKLNDSFTNMDTTTRQLNVQGSKKDEIMGKLVDASFIERHSKSFLLQDIDDAMEQLRVLHKNTLATSTSANQILADWTAIFSPEGVTIKDGQGNEVNYRASPANVGDTAGPKETPDSLPDHKLAVSACSVVSVR